MTGFKCLFSIIVKLTLENFSMANLRLLVNCRTLFAILEDQIKLSGIIPRSAVVVVGSKYSVIMLLKAISLGLTIRIKTMLDSEEA